MSVSRAPTAALGDRFLCLLVPWRVYEYPGSKRVFGELLGVSWRTAERYRHGKLPEKHRVTLLGLARQRAQAWADLADALEGTDQGF